MKKKLLSILLSASMLAALLAGCGSGNIETGTTTQESNAETTENAAEGSTPAAAASESSDEAVTLKWAIWDKDITPLLGSLEGRLRNIPSQCQN